MTTYNELAERAKKVHVDTPRTRLKYAITNALDLLAQQRTGQEIDAQGVADIRVAIQRAVQISSTNFENALDATRVLYPTQEEFDKEPQLRTAHPSEAGIEELTDRLACEFLLLLNKVEAKPNE